jgi:hypothetical protein
MKSFTYQIAIMILAALTVLPVLADDSKEAATAELEQGKILNRRYEFKFNELLQKETDSADRCTAWTL